MPLQAPLVLSTGALARYPLRRKSAFATRTAKFADFSRQTFAQIATPLSQWQLNLQLLQDSEIADWMDFYKTVQGGATPFSFIDPWDNLLQYSEQQEESSVWITNGASCIGQNYLLNSQDFEASSWTLANTGTSNPTVAPDSEVAPDGTTTADQISFPSIPNTAGDQSYIYQATNPPAIADLTFTFSVWLRVTSGTANIRIEVSDFVSQNSSQNCSITTTWQRFSTTFTFNSSPGSHVFAVLVNPQNSSAVTVSVWGAQLEFGQTPSDYTQTNSAVTPLEIADPYFVQAPSSAPGFAENLNSSCVKRGRQIVVTNVAALLYQGVAVAPGGSGNSRKNGLTLTASAWIKKQDSSSPSFSFQVSDLLQENGTVSIAPSPTWSRVSVSHQFSAGNSASQAALLMNVFSATGVFYIFGCQLECGAVASPYKKTTAYCGFHPKCYLPDDLNHTASEYNVNTLDQLTIEESN